MCIFIDRIGLMERIRRYFKVYRTYFLVSLLLFVVLSSSLSYVYFGYKATEIYSIQNELLYRSQNKVAKIFSLYTAKINNLSHEYNILKIRGKSNYDIALSWKGIIEAYPNIDHIRYISYEGMEVIRVNNSGGESYIVPQDELQDKSNRYYIEDGKLLKKGEITFSMIDLNIENGKIDIDHNGLYKPCVRAVAPVFDDGVQIGTLIINFNLLSALESVYNLGAEHGIKTYVLNHDYFIMNDENHDNNFNWMYEDRKDKNFLSQFNVSEELFNKTIRRMKTPEGSILQLTSEYKDISNDLNVAFVGDYFKTILVTFYPVESEYGVFINWNYYNGIKYTWPVQIVLFVVLMFLAGALSYRKAKELDEIHIFKQGAEADDLTGFYIRNVGMRKIRNLLKNKKSPFSLAFVDLNGLKEVNDNLGHEIGDELIATLSQIIKQSISEYEQVIRWGGDEFIIISRKSSSAEDLNELFNKIIAKANKVNATDKHPFVMSISYGVANSTSLNTKITDKEDSDSIEQCVAELLKLADDAMYKMKSQIKMAGFSSIKGGIDSNKINLNLYNNVSIGYIVNKKVGWSHDVSIVMLNHDFFSIYLRRNFMFDNIGYIVVNDERIRVKIIKVAKFNHYKVLVAKACEFD